MMTARVGKAKRRGRLLLGIDGVQAELQWWADCVGVSSDIGDTGLGEPRADSVLRLVGVEGGGAVEGFFEQ